MWIIQVKPLIQPRGFTKTHGFFGQVVFTHGISQHPGSPKPISSKGLSSSNFRGDFSWFFYPFLCARSWIFRCLFKIFDAYDVCKMHYVDIVESEKRYCNPTHLDPTFHQNMFNQNPSSYLTKLPFLPTRTVSANLISRIVESDCSELLPLLPFWDTIHTLFRCTFIKLASIYPSSHSSIISGKWLKGNDPFGGSSHPLPWFHKATVDRRNTIPNAGMYPKPCKKWDNHLNWWLYRISAIHPLGFQLPSTPVTIRQFRRSASPTARRGWASPRGVARRWAWRHEFRHGVSAMFRNSFRFTYWKYTIHGWFPTRNFIEFENIGKKTPSWRWDDLFQELCKELGDSVTWVTSWHWCLLIFHTARSIVPCRDPLRRQFQNAELFWDVHTIHGRFTNMER